MSPLFSEKKKNPCWTKLQPLQRNGSPSLGPAPFVRVKKVDPEKKICGETRSCKSFPNINVYIKTKLKESRTSPFRIRIVSKKASPTTQLLQKPSPPHIFLFFLRCSMCLAASSATQDSHYHKDREDEAWNGCS